MGRLRHTAFHARHLSPGLSFRTGRRTDDQYCGVLQLLFNPYVLFPMQLVLDYILAFGALGLSGLFAGAKRGLLKGYLVGIFGRYVFTVLSGWIFFAEYAWEGWHPLPYSLVYNGIYIFAEGAITCAVILVPAVSSGLAAVKKMALS